MKENIYNKKKKQEKYQRKNFFLKIFVSNPEKKNGLGLEKKEREHQIIEKKI
jgi:hypothetical protein